jgi:transposase
MIVVQRDIICATMTLAQQLKRVEQKNAELAAQLQLREQLNLSLIKDLSVEKEDLEREANRLLARLEQERAKRESLETDYQRLKAEFAEKTTLMREEIAFLKAQFYGRSSEKSSADVSADQVMLFNEVEVLAAIAAAEGCQSAPIQVPAHERKRHGGKLIPADFPREEVAHDLAEAEKFCSHDGTPLKAMGAEEALRYHFKRPELIVKVHKRLKYSCPKCRQCVKIAPLAPHILPKSQAEPSLLANITVAKYVDGLPLNRQSQQLARLGLDLGADTMATWLNTIGVERLPPLIHLMHEAVLNEPYLHFDDTTVQVLKSERAPTADHYMFVLAAGPPGRRMVLYMYASTRNATILKLLLSGPNGPYRGKAVCDGLKLHDLLVEDPAFEGLKLFGCLTHCRRYYDRADKVTELPSQQSLARVAIKTYLGKVFYIERQIEEQRVAFERSGGTWDLAQTLKIRQERSKPIMLAFKQWVDDLAPGVPPKSALGKALGYTISQWEKLRRFLDDPEVPAHNNRVENDIRPFAVGRRAWLFMDTQIGARASANLFTLAQTCRANGIAPVNYFEHLYERLPYAKTVGDLEALLPWNYKRLLKAAS